MRIAELHTLPRHTVRAILENHEYSQLYMPAFSRLWHQTQVIIDVSLGWFMGRDCPPVTAVNVTPLASLLRPVTMSARNLFIAIWFGYFACHY